MVTDVQSHWLTTAQVTLARCGGRLILIVTYSIKLVQTQSTLEIVAGRFVLGVAAVNTVYDTPVPVMTVNVTVQERCQLRSS